MAYVTDTDLAATGVGQGAAMVGFKQSGIGMHDQSSLTILRRTGVWLTDHPSADPSGTTDSKAAFDASLAEAVLTGRALVIPKGLFKLSLVAFPTTGPIVIEGHGEDSQLIVAGANQSSIFQAIGCGRLRLYDLRLTGDGTATSTSDGRGLLVADTDDVELDSLLFDNFGMASIYGRNSSPQRGERFAMRNIRCTDGKNPTQGFNADILLWNNWSKITGENIILDAAEGSGSFVEGTIVPSTETPFDGFSIADTTSYPNTPAAPVSDLILNNVRVTGHTGRGIALGSEFGLPSGSQRFQVSNYTAINCGCAALKSKHVTKVQLSNIYAKGCDRLGGERPVSGLCGTLLLNANDSATLNGIVLEDCGQTGVTMIGADLGEPTGELRGRHSINGLIVNSSGGYSSPTVGAGLYVPFGVLDLTVNGFVANDVLEGILIRAAASHPLPGRITINAPIIRRTTAQTGIRVLGVPGNTVGQVIVNSPNIADTATAGIQVTFCDYFELTGGTVQSPGGGGSTGFAVNLSDNAYVKIHGVRLVAAEAATGGSYGIRFAGGATTYAEINDCDLLGSFTGPVLLVTAPTTLRANNNRGWLETKATVNPTSLATGASTTPATAAVADAALGDKVQASFSNSLAGAQLTAWVSSAGSISYYFTNVNGTNPLDLGSGTLSIKASKG